MLNQSLRRALLAPDLDVHIRDFIETLWNDKDPMFRHNFRMLFLGVKPNSVDFLINIAIALHKLKTPEE